MLKGFTVSTDNPDHLMLFREHVSRKAASKGRAVLEGVGLDSSKIEACFNSNPLKEEEAVQTGLIRWSEGQGYKLPTWAALLDAMKYAKLAQQDIQDLEEKLTHKTVRSLYKRLFLYILVFVCSFIIVYVHGYMYVYKCDSTCICTGSQGDLPICTCMAKTQLSFPQEEHMKA